jgi:hypothetical protein
LLQAMQPKLRGMAVPETESAAACGHSESNRTNAISLYGAAAEESGAFANVAVDAFVF